MTVLKDQLWVCVRGGHGRAHERGPNKRSEMRVLRELHILATVRSGANTAMGPSTSSNKQHRVRGRAWAASPLSRAAGTPSVRWTPQAAGPADFLVLDSSRRRPGGWTA